MRISDWSSDVCSSDLLVVNRTHRLADRSRVEFSDLASDTLLINTECEMVEELKACLEANDIVDTATHQVATQEDLMALLDANLGVALHPAGARSEERRVGKEGVSQCSSRGQPDWTNKKQDIPNTNT